MADCRTAGTAPADGTLQKSFRVTRLRVSDVAVTAKSAFQKNSRIRKSSSPRVSRGRAESMT